MKATENKKQIEEAVKKFNDSHEIKLEFESEEFPRDTAEVNYMARYCYDGEELCFIGCKSKPCFGARLGDAPEYLDEFLETLD